MRVVVAGATGAIGKQAGAASGRGRLRAELLASGLVSQVPTATMWRWLAGDPIRPWQHHWWIFPRDRGFAATATVVLDLYQRVYDGAPPGAGGYAIGAGEKTSTQARCRRHPGPCHLPGPG